VIGQLDRIRELEKLQNPKSNNSSQKIVAVTSGKGGTGKTFLAANFAYQLSKSKKILLVDLDFNLSNLHLLFNAHPKKTLNNYFASKSLFEEIITKYNSDLDLIFGDSGIVNQNKPTVYQIERMLDELDKISSIYDLIIFDLGAGVSEENLFVLSKSKIKLVVTNPEPTALMDAYVLIKLLKANNAEDGINVIVNRCYDELEGYQAYDNLKSAVDHFLKSTINFIAEIPESVEVRKSIIDQKLFAEHQKSNMVITSINKALGEFGKIHQVFNINQPALQHAS
jgi:flagellar biosynthesis protein FlhG